MINYRVINEKLVRDKQKLSRDNLSFMGKMLGHLIGCYARCFRERQWLPQLKEVCLEVNSSFYLHKEIN